MNFPDNLMYTKTHEWVDEIGSNKFRVGLSDFAQDSLGDLVFINLPEIEDEAEAGEPIADVESVKAVSDIYSPANGEISAINEELLDQPELINEDPYNAWIFEIDITDEKVELLNPADYKKYCEEEA